MQRYAAPEIKINFFLYGADIPYSQDFAKQFVFFKTKCSRFLFFLLFFLQTRDHLKMFGFLHERRGGTSSTCSAAKKCPFSRVDWKFIFVIR